MFVARSLFSIRHLASRIQSGRCQFSTMTYAHHSLPASFYRGGTSKALIFQRDHLPSDAKERDAIFLAAMGSPDPNGRQLDGMGGGYSSVSKVLIIGRSEHPEADVDYTFAQVSVNAPIVDYSSNCGNMLAAVGPFALENRLVEPASQGGQNLVRIHNTNTKKIIHATFPVSSNAEADLSGSFAIDGVSGTHARITLDFISPEGSRTGRLFPTGDRIEDLALPDGTSIRASLMDCGNPCVFILASDLGVDPAILPQDLEQHAGGQTLHRLSDIRNAAAVKMGLVDSLEAAARAKSVPKVCIMSPKANNVILSGETLSAAKIDIVTRCISAGDPHRALPITASLCAAAAAQIDGTIVNACLSGPRVSQGVIIGHASGTIEVDADVATGDDGQLHVPKARVFRTARKLFEGKVFV